MSLAQTFARTGFARFINSPAGRWVRILAGVVLVVWGYTQRGTAAGIVLIVIGLVPLVAGSFDWCLISALLGGPLKGAVLRKSGQEQG
jgi:hypothetical protein